MKNARGALIRFIRDPRHDPIAILGAAVSHFRASDTPGAAAIADVIDDAIAAELARLAGKLPITAREAITFAIEHIDDRIAAVDFLECWQHGEWDLIRANWPNALGAAPVSAIETPATTGHPPAEKRISGDL